MFWSELCLDLQAVQKNLLLTLNKAVLWCQDGSTGGCRLRGSLFPSQDHFLIDESFRLSQRGISNTGECVRHPCCHTTAVAIAASSSMVGPTSSTEGGGWICGVTFSGWVSKTTCDGQGIQFCMKCPFSPIFLRSWSLSSKWERRSSVPDTFLF